MKFRITTPAQIDLESIWDFTDQNWGEEQADLYIDLLMVRMAWILANKGLWNSKPEIQDGVYFYTEKSHVIYFSEYSGNIDILRVLHGCMDPDLHLA